MTIRSTHDKHLDIRAVHEAGHAIAAVRMRVPFSYVSIESDILPGSGGHTMMTLPLHNGTLRSIQRLLVALFAGASAADHILNLDGAFYEAQIAGDLGQIKSTIAASKTLIPAKRRKAFAEACRVKAETLVRMPFAVKAIKDVAKKLIVSKRLSAGRVKKIYAVYRAQKA
jgi:hypothetical protein